jgi:hypothetical protein
MGRGSIGEEGNEERTWCTQKIEKSGCLDLVSDFGGDG